MTDSQNIKLPHTKSSRFETDIYLVDRGAAVMVPMTKTDLAYLYQCAIMKTPVDLSKIQELNKDMRLAKQLLDLPF